jgi:hypothetical protein
MSHNKERLLELLHELEKLVKHMEIPVYRRSNVCWLRKNLRVKNSDHPHFESAMKLVEELLSHGVGHG